jgi:hypothetical protein
VRKSVKNEMLVSELIRKVRSQKKHRGKIEEQELRYLKAWTKLETCYHMADQWIGAM